MNLYRKYRPKKFKEIIGQEVPIRALSRQIALGLVSHAYLFAGPRGSGKTTTARIFAKALNCQSVNYQPKKDNEPINWQKKITEKDYEPCNKCPICQSIENGTSLNLVEIDAASNRGIDEIRNLKEAVKYPPPTGKYKVYILDEAHMLTPQASNALLKTLEEPPKHIVFILATTEPEKLLPTIVSRTQRFDFKRLTIPQIVSRLEYILEKENIKAPRAVLEEIALASEGGMRDAEAFLEQAISVSGGKINENILEEFWGWVSLAKIDRFLDFIVKGQTKQALEWIDKIYSQGYDLNWFLTNLLNYLRDLYFYIIDSRWSKFSLYSEDSLLLIKERSKVLDLRKINNLISLFLRARDELKKTPIATLPIEMALIEAIEENK